MFQRTATARIAAFFAAAAFSSVLVASQFSLAQRYTDQGAAQLAGVPAAKLQTGA